MTSTHFHVCYASVTNALFEHLEQDLLLLTTALIEEDEDFSFRGMGGPEMALQEGVVP